MKRQLCSFFMGFLLTAFAPVAAQQESESASEDFGSSDLPIPFAPESTDLGRTIAKGGAQAGGVGMKCMACHGLEGGGRDKVPRLAGLPFDYLADQIEAYIAGERQSAIMGPIAAQLTADEVGAVLSYYAALPAPQSEPPLDLDWNLVDAGALLVYAGRQTTGVSEVTACVMCHNPVGELNNVQIAPPLAGQPVQYIEAQLKAWRKGERSGDPLRVMERIALAMTDEEIAAAAAYYASRNPAEVEE